MFCTGCGLQLSAGDRFCSSCGQAVTSSTDAPDAPPTEEPPGPPPGPDGPPPGPPPGPPSGPGASTPPPAGPPPGPATSAARPPAGPPPGPAPAAGLGAETSPPGTNVPPSEPGSESVPLIQRPEWQRGAAIVLAVAAVGGGAWWFLRDDGDDQSLTSATTTAVTAETTVGTQPPLTEPPTTLTPTTVPPATAPSTTIPPTTVPPTTVPPTTAPPTTVAPTTVPPTTVPPTTIPPTTLPPQPPPNAPIGLEWINDGRMPTPDFEFVGGTYLIDDQSVVELMFGPTGFQIWLEAATGTSGDFLTVRLDDAVTVELTELTDVVLGLTACTVDGRATNRIVGTFIYEDAPELTTPVSVWEIDPAAMKLVPVTGAVTCTNEAFGV